MMKTPSMLALAALLASPLAAQAMTAEEIVAKHCTACHQAGLGGAPKLDDQAAWAPRLAKGVEAMAQTVLTGKGAMPPKGTCGSCDEASIKAAIELMTAPLQ